MPRQSYNIAWIYSHPDLAQPQNLTQYDFIFSLSDSFRTRLQDMGFQSQLLIGATSKEPFPSYKLNYPAVFVGNARPRGDPRPAVQFLMESSYPFLVWGDRWEENLPSDCIGGIYYDNQRLDRLYATSAFSINDHHNDMRKYGFVAVKIFDILASGGFAVSDSNPGIEPIFADTVPQFRSTNDLQVIFEKYAPGSTERETLRKRGQEIALSHTWDDRAETFIDHIETALNPETVREDIHSAFAERSR